MIAQEEGATTTVTTTTTIAAGANSKATFSGLGLDGRVHKALAENGFEAPFPIQQMAIPIILQGKDLIGQAHTGTGKTAAFTLPMLTKIVARGGGGSGVQALVLVPTRELAMQVTSEVSRFAKYTGARAAAIYGGQSFGPQRDALKRGVQVVVATPGRLIDHIERRTIRLDSVNIVVLDEADRMLDMGFIDDIKFILSHVKGRGDRQTLLFSATMPGPILKLAKEYMRHGNDLKEIRLNSQELTVDAIEQSYLVVNEQDKLRHLIGFIKSDSKKEGEAGRQEHGQEQQRQQQEQQQSTIVFAATKRRADRLASSLKAEGLRANAIHGDLSQKERDRVMSRFRSGADSILVATDIAARGIDVLAVGQVINYDVPEDPDTYFHRIGRTARAGAAGKAVSLVSPDRINDFQRILKQTRLPVTRLNEVMGIAAPAASAQHQPRRQHYRQQHQQQRGQHRPSHGSGSNRSPGGFRKFRRSRGRN